MSPPSVMDRRRRIVVQYDAHGQLGAPFDEWLTFRFHYVDMPGSMIDSIIWDIGWGSWASYPSEVLPRFEHPGLKIWYEQGIEWVGELVKATRERGLECLWNHRVSEVDINPLPDLGRETELMMDHLNPVKAAHPDWTIKTWWWQGTWNYAVPEVREYNLAILRELGGQYDLDGFQLDFARHIPCLPVGRQWELREGVTEFVRMVRGMLEKTAARRGKPYLLGARVPNTLESCRADGLDVGTWAEEGLVDFLTLGTRSMSVDIEGFREAVGEGAKLQPCFDDHHATDGYRFQPIDFLRGVFANWWQQGADSVATFNWGNAPAEVAEATLERWGRGTFNEAPSSHGEAYLEVGEAAAMAGRDKVFAVERRGGYPWAEGALNRNDDAPLPLVLRPDGTAAEVMVRVADDVMATGADVRLRVVLFGAREGDAFAATLNGTPLGEGVSDFEWKDAQIF
ncbi:MAG: family 10 glycosylhydrolase [Armatimonadetes bacterium]|nr:family 10 glycosylhydrolase [Armatimonadota bacterium]